MTKKAKAPAIRDKHGRFLKGKSGNPNGRPLGRKNHLSMLKQDLEIAIRENLQPGNIRKIVAKMCEEAVNGNVGAAKLILDKTISNAREAEEVNETGKSFVFKVENLTFKTDDDKEVIDITPQKEA